MSYLSDKKTAYYAARVALMRVPARGGETQVSVGPDVWKVVMSAKEVRVDANNSTASYTFNP